jgi:hypothetical protein
MPAHKKISLHWMVSLWLLAVLLAGLAYPLATAAQVTQPGPTPTPSPAAALERADIPGNTTVLLIAAAGLTLIVFGAVLWHNRRR